MNGQKSWKRFEKKKKKVKHTTLGNFRQLLVWECKCGSLLLYLNITNHLKAFLATISPLYWFRHKRTSITKSSLLLVAAFDGWLPLIYYPLLLQFLTTPCGSDLNFLSNKQLNYSSWFLLSHQCAQWEALICCVTAACKGWIIWISTFNLAGFSQDTKCLLWQVWICVSMPTPISLSGWKPIIYLGWMVGTQFWF